MTSTAAAAEDAPAVVASDDETTSMMDEHDLRRWLPRKQMLLLDKYLQELRLSRLTTAPQPGDTTTSHNNNHNRLRTAHQTVNLLRHLIGTSSNVAWRTAADLLRLLRALGRVLQEAAGPREPAVANLVRRVMAAVREEALREAQEAAAADKQQAATTTMPPPPSVQTDRLSLQTMLWALPQHVRASSRRRGKSFVGGGAAAVVEGGVVQRQESLASEAEMMESNSSAAGGAGGRHHHHPFPESFYAPRPNLKQAVLEALQEIITDLEDLHRNINEQVVHHIHAGEIILTIGDDSQTVESFLKAAHAKQQQQSSSSQHGSSSTSNTNPFTVLVCGGSSAMAARLAAAGIDTTHMETAAVFAIMPRVHKVLLPAYAVLANGGLVAPTGANLVALAAYYQRVPVVCVTGLLYKLCPLYPHEGQDTVLQDLGSPVPELVRDFAELHEDDDDNCWDGVELIHPRHDYIQPQHISLYITNVGSFQPSFIYRLLAENYHSDDWESFLE